LQRSENFLAQGRLIDGTKSRDPGNSPDVGVLRAGLLMGKITTGGLYAPSVYGVFASAYTSGGTTLNVGIPGAVELARRLGQSGTLNAIGPPTANGTNAVTSVTFSAVNVATGDITVSSLGVNKVAGTLLTPSDGSEVPIAFIPDWEYPLQVIDQDGISIAAVDFPKLPVAAVIDSPQLLPWPSDTSIQAYIVASLNGASGGQFVFSHRY